MPIRIRLKFKPEQKEDINFIFERELKNYKQTLRKLSKPLTWSFKQKIKAELKKAEIDPVETDAAITKIQNGYNFKAEFTSDTDAFMEWNGHFLIDYDGEKGEAVAKALYPLFYGFDFRIRNILMAIMTGQFKRALHMSLNDPEPVSVRVKKRMFEEAEKIFKAIDVVMVLE